jgi:hypothetical protein
MCYLLWRLRTLRGVFGPAWQRDTADRAGWSPRVVEAGMSVAFVLTLASVVVSWLT